MGDSMQFNTSVTFEGVEPDETVVRLVSNKIRDLRHIRREHSACRVSVCAKPRDERQEREYRARLSLHLVAEFESEYLYPPRMELHASDGALMTAIRKAFVKAHELLVPK
jgi:hypothetical protein